MSLRDRIAALEARHATTNEPQTIVIAGGLCDGVADHALANGTPLTREADEPFPTFRARVITHAKTGRDSFVIFGGLPDQLPVDSMVSTLPDPLATLGGVEL